jgi:hypothetical protein
MGYREQFVVGVELVGALEPRYYTPDRMAGMRAPLRDS